MVAEDVVNKILEYLKKHGQTNTFKLASELGIDRYRILKVIKKLEEKGAVEVRSGIVRFLKFPVKEKRVKKKIAKVKKAPSKPKKKIKHKKTALEIFQAENKRLKERILELETKAPPKIITRTKVKEVVKRVPVKSRKLKEQTEQIEKLEEEIKELRKKASKPRIIRRTIIKKVPKIIRKTIIRKVPVKIKEKIRPRKFRLPKINFLGLGKNIKRLNVPEMLKK